MTGKSIAFSIHPEYLERQAAWEKFRYILKGGQDFVDKYVITFSDDETPTEFALRKSMTPVAGFAKAALIDIQNSIFQRLWAIRRKGGTDSWRSAVKGQLSGVDLQGSSMNHFVGTKILLELLAMGKVGIYVDNFANKDGTLIEAKGKHPYVYKFVAEDIRNWEYNHANGKKRLNKVLLRVRAEVTDPSYYLIDSLVEQYRYYFLTDNGTVGCETYDAKGEFLYDQELELTRIPLEILELESSLLEDIANHQIALTNMESADVSYGLRCNVPFYTEQFNQAMELQRNWNQGDDTENGDQGQIVKIGATTGRRYPMGADRPGFINPSGEPLTVSMEKQRALKEDIRSLVNLALSSTRPRFASAESKELDDRGLESGLSALGLVLENSEKAVGELWSEYENSKDAVTVNYPQRYSLRSDDERRKDAKQLAESSSDVPSITFRKEIQVEIAEILLEGKVSDEELDIIIKEIRVSKAPTADPEQIRSDVEIGLVSREFASVTRGYPQGEAEKARKEKEEAELLRMKSQSRGFGDGDRGLNPEEAKEEKQESQNPEMNSDGIKKVRKEAR